MSTAIDHEIAVEINGRELSFPSFTAAADAGFPVSCQWFARCENAADVALSHPVLDAVPTCNRCAAKVEALA